MKKYLILLLIIGGCKTEDQTQIKETIKEISSIVLTYSASAKDGLDASKDTKPTEIVIKPEEPKPEIKNDLDIVEKWEGTSVKDWPVTSQLDFSISKGKLIFKHTKADIWPCWISPKNNKLNGNTWVIYLKDGKWRATTFEWAGRGVFSKPITTADRPDLGRDLKLGDKVGFMVSGLIRGRERNVSERTQVVWVTWE